MCKWSPMSLDEWKELNKDGIFFDTTKLVHTGDKMDLENIYTYHAPKEGQPEKYETLRAKAKEFAQLIIDTCPDSRERSVALTQLETSVFWANASIARNE